MNLKNLKLKQNSKIKLKCFFTLILVFTIVISSIPNINVFANESYEYKYAGDKNGFIINSKIPDNSGQRAPKIFEVKHKTNDNDISKAYCLDLDVFIDENINYSMSNIEDTDYYTPQAARKIRAIVKNSYPYVDIENLAAHLKIKSETDDEEFELSLIESGREDLAIKAAITATQLAIWNYSSGFNYPGLSSDLREIDEQTPIADTTIRQNITSDVKKIYYKLLSLEGEDASVPVAKILSKEPIIVSENGDTVDIEFRFKIDGKNIIESDYEVKIKSDDEVEVEPEDLEIIEYDELDEDEYKRIKVINIPLGKDIELVISGIQYINKDVYLYKPEGGRGNSQNLIGARSDNINVSEIFDYKCDFGEVEVTKVDSEDETIPLKGAKFTIRKSPSGEFVRDIITKEDGTASAKLFPGDYTIEETQAPEGYKKSEIIEDFTITDNKVKIGIDFINEKLTPASISLEATKILHGRKLKANEFSFRLLNLDNNKDVKTVKNDAEGNIKFSDLTFYKAGIYNYQMVEDNEGLDGIIYDDSEFKVTVKVTDDGKGNLEAEVIYPEGEIVFENSVIGEETLEFTKTDVSTGEVIDGAKIKITCIEGLDKDKVIEFTSSKEGNKFELKAGKYKFEETQAPEGYELTTEVGTFEIKENGEIVKVELKNYPTKGTLEFTKIDVSTGEVIDGAEIKITCTEGLDKGKVIEFTSSKEGNKFELKAGKYTFEETQAPEGYELTTEVGTFEIKENGEVVKAELKNYPIKGSAKLIKVDKDDKEKRIQGAKFVLLASDKETIIAENLVTDSEGKIIVSNLEPGTYYFKETEAASGYILDETLIEVKVEGNQQTISTVTFENQKEEDGGLPDVDPEGDTPEVEEEGGSPDTDSNVSSPNTNTNNNTNSNVNSSTNSSGSYPKTSDTSIAGYAINGIVSIGTLVGINRKRKDK